MKRLAIVLLLASLTLVSFAQDRLISSEFIKTITADELVALMKKNRVPRRIAPPKYDVNVYEVVYMSEWPDGTPVKASGLYYVPQGMEESAPIMAYHHGTRIVKERKEFKIGGQVALCIGFATSGYAVTMPDYLGLGKGDGRHIYQHAQSEAQASIDMIRTVRNELNTELDFKTNDQIYLTGYSQGGHAAMATHKIMQEQYGDEFTVTASAPMSGAYDMTGMQTETMYKEYTHPGYLPYLFVTMNDVYNLYDNIYEIFKSPYDTLLPPMLTGKNSMGDLNRILPSVPKDMIKEEYVKEFETNPDFAFTKALAENNVHDWKPEAPMMICYCKSDEQVNYKNALVAHKTMKENGAKNVRLRHAGKKYGHNKCALFSSMYVKYYFESIRKGKERGRKGPLFKRFIISLGKLAVKGDAKVRKKKAKELAKQEKLAQKGKA